MISLKLNTLNFKKLLSLLFICLISCQRGSVVQQGAQAFNYELSDIAGNKKTLIEAGQVTVVNFFATWCSSCLEEVDELNSLQESFPDLKIIAVTNESDVDAIKEFAKKVKFKILIDKEDKVGERYKVTAFPETVIVNKSGKFMIFKDPEYGTPTVKVKGSRKFGSETFKAEMRRLLNDTSSL